MFFKKMFLITALVFFSHHVCLSMHRQKISKTIPQELWTQLDDTNIPVEAISPFTEFIHLTDEYDNNILSLLTRLAYLKPRIKAYVEHQIRLFDYTQQDAMNYAWKVNKFGENFLVIAVYRGLSTIVREALRSMRDHWTPEAIALFSTQTYACKIGGILDRKNLLGWAVTPPFPVSYANDYHETLVAVFEAHPSTDPTLQICYHTSKQYLTPPIVCAYCHETRQGHIRPCLTKNCTCNQQYPCCNVCHLFFTAGQAILPSPS